MDSDGFEFEDKGGQREGLCVCMGGHGSPKRLHRWEGEYRWVLKGGVQVGLNFTGGFKDVKCE